MTPTTWRGEFGGALGDLGTLVPFLVGFVVVAGVHPTSVLLAFGVSFAVAGWRFGIPFPVQPMKAIGAAALAHTVAGSPAMPQVLALCALLSGLFWLLAGWTGAARWLARHLSKDVVHGVLLGLGIALILAGLRRIEADWVLGLASVLLALALLGRAAWLLMPLLLITGIAIGLWRQPVGALDAAYQAAPLLSDWPSWSWGSFDQPSTWLAALSLTAVQIPLTFGNAVVGTVAEARRLFPGVAIDENRVARSTGWMNLLAAGLVAPPMCHGAGGLAAQVALGARTGRAPLLLGSVLVLLGLFASGHVATLLSLLPPGTLGAMLFVAGFSLTIGTAGSPRDKTARAVLLTTAAISVWNAGAGLIAGLLLETGLRQRWFQI